MHTCTLNRLQIKRIFLVATLIIAAVLFYLYNVNTPLYADDYHYSFSFYDGSRIDSIGDILLSLKAHYHSMNGRLVTHFFAHLYLMLDKWVFNSVNTLVFLGLGLLIYRFSGFGWKNPRPTFLAAIFSLLYSEMPDFAESMLWTDASATYLHGTVLILLFLLPYWEHCFQSRTSGNHLPAWLPAVFYPIFGFCAGGTSENVSLALLAMLTALLVVSCFRKNTRCWMITGFTGAVAGYLFMLSAPGNANRLSSFGTEATLLHYFNNFKTITIQLTVYLRMLLLIGILLFAVFLFSRRKKSFREMALDCLPLLILLLGTGISLYSMIVVDYFPLRAWCGTVILGIISCGYLFGQLNFSHFAVKAIVNLVLAVLIINTLFQSIGTYRMLTQEMAHYNARVNSIQTQIAEGKTDIWIPQLTGSSKFSCFWGENNDIVDDASHWTNTGMARYWGVSSINKLP